MTPTVDVVVDVAHRMLFVTFLMSLPVLATALVVGILISLIQTVTGLQEMTITFVPKLLAVLAVLAASLPWMIRTMMDYTEGIMDMMSSLSNGG